MLNCGHDSSLLIIPDYVESHECLSKIQHEIVFPTTRNTSIYGREEPRDVVWQGSFDLLYSKLTFRAGLYSPTVLMLKGKVEETLGVTMDGALLNRYVNGTDSIAAHSDDEKELGTNPIVAAISLGAERTMIFRPKDTSGEYSRFKVPLTPGSLVVMFGAFQRQWTHEIPKEKHVTDVRISITFRRSAELVRTQGIVLTLSKSVHVTVKDLETKAAPLNASTSSLDAYFGSGDKRPRTVVDLTSEGTPDTGPQHRCDKKT
jgi:alkylated DNA repair dioxygenase AlkB